MFKDFYGMEDPKNQREEDFKALTKRLQKKKVLKINVIENESYKIKKDESGVGVKLDTNISTKDPTMQLYYKHLVNMMITMDNKDKFIKTKYE